MAAELVWEDGGLIFRLTCSTNFNEIRRTEDEFYSDPRADDIRTKLVDMTGLEVFDVTPEQLMILAAFHVGQSQSNPHVRQAIVTPAHFAEQVDVFIEGMSGSPWKTRRFDNMEEARAWAAARS